MCVGVCVGVPVQLSWLLMASVQRVNALTSSTACLGHFHTTMTESLVAARPSKTKSNWDRDQALASVRTGSSAAVNRLYGDAHNPKRNARALRQREAISSYVPPPKSKPEGYELMTNRPEMFSSMASSRSQRSIKYTERGKETARGVDMSEMKAKSAKKVDFGGGHPMWSPYYRPTGRTADGKVSNMCQCMQCASVCSVPVYAVCQCMQCASVCSVPVYTVCQCMQCASVCSVPEYAV